MATAHQPPAPWTLDLQRPGPAPWHPQHQRATARSRRPRGAPPPTGMSISTSDRRTGWPPAARRTQVCVRIAKGRRWLRRQSVPSRRRRRDRPRDWPRRRARRPPWTWLAPAVSGERLL